MLLARRLSLLSIALLALPARADDDAATRCMGRLLTATGLGAPGGLEVGGDVDVVLVHAGDVTWVFSSRGVFRAEKPWPATGVVGFEVAGLDRPRRYTWHVKRGVVQSQSNAPGPTTIVADRWAAYDAAAW